MFITEYLGLNDNQLSTFNTLGVFDAVINGDNHFFVNVNLLKKSRNPIFIEAYNRLNAFFTDIATLLDAADVPSITDKMYKAAKKRFKFHEVNGINLGFSRSKYGSGWGDILSNRVLLDAYQIVKKGSKQPEIFHLVSLFEDDIGPDRLSDMIATIIEPEIIKYTLSVMRELNISKETFPSFDFDDNGLIINPYKNADIMFLPTEILHELPIAKDWYDIDRVVSQNETIKREVSEEVGKTWGKWASSEQKRYIREKMFMDPTICKRIIDGYRQAEVAPYDLRDDFVYCAELIFKEIKGTKDFKRKTEQPTSLMAMQTIISIFKDWVENNRGWAQIQDALPSKREKMVQRLIHLAAKYYVEVNNLDISCEPDDGRGPLDIKLSRGTDKTLAEVKLSSNNQYLHGLDIQIQEYASAERTRDLIYVFVDVGNPGRRKKIIAHYNEVYKTQKNYPQLIIVDACPRKSASTFVPKNDEFPFDELEKFDFDFPEIDISELDSLDLD